MRRQIITEASPRCDGRVLVQRRENLEGLLDCVRWLSSLAHHGAYGPAAPGSRSSADRTAVCTRVHYMMGWARKETASKTGRRHCKYGYLLGMLVADRPASVGWLRTSVVRAAGEGKGVGVGGEGEESFARSAGSNLTTTWVGGDPGERNEGVDTASSLDRPRGRVLCFAPEVAHGTNVPCPACVQVSVLWEPEEGVCAASECE